ncbi:hypothetical protein E3N88_25586 [Mikania micrantha]|uniref:Uncharacterized protein n=1 Tax=Mikania micrantha TaxID=192012 RepID=A0A5N6N7Z1_9ASTR|nr:hypothetical protein E3N88_25586 [Mikania micrantha]
MRRIALQLFFGESSQIKTVAVCKDEIGIEAMARQLSRTHHYCRDCIVSWFRIQNTRRVCRHELPADEPNYERVKAERKSGKMEEDVVIKLVVEEARLEEEEDVEEMLHIETMTRVNLNAMNVVNMITSDMNALKERKD